MSKCPQGLAISELLRLSNEYILSGNKGMLKGDIADYPEDKRPSACIGCGACAKVCPQKIDIPGIMTKISEAVAE